MQLAHEQDAVLCSNYLGAGMLVMLALRVIQKNVGKVGDSCVHTHVTKAFHFD